MKQVNLTFWDLWCERHGEAFRANWPQGVPKAGALLMGVIMSRYTAETVHAALKQARGCCQVAPDQLVDILTRCKTGGMGICLNCSHHAEGVQYREASHLCFTCIVHENAGVIN